MARATSEYGYGPVGIEALAEKHKKDGAAQDPAPS